MKRTIQKLSLALMAVWLAAALTNARGQATIIYVSGPSFPFQPELAEPSGADLDLDQDGTVDFSFRLGPFIAPTLVVGFPGGGGASAPFYVLALGTNSILLRRSSQATILPFGALIGNTAPFDSTWSSPDQTANVATYFISQYSPSGIFGPLADVGVGYLAVRLEATDGVHYGWVRLRIAPEVEVVDWAYEARPNTPIRAGIIGSNGQSLQFTVNFPGPKTTLTDRVGTFILTGDTLRGELTFADSFFSADIAGPVPANAKSKAFASLGQPLARRADFTSFLGDVSLSRSQIIHLLRSADHVSIDSGAIAGQITPIK